MSLENFFKTTTPQKKLGVFSYYLYEEVVFLSMNDTQHAVNRFTRESLNHLNDFLVEIFSLKQIKGLVFFSQKLGCFLAGADIDIFQTLQTKQDGENAASELQKLFEKFSTSSVPTVAAIHGVCLGGGLEMSLAMHARVCSNHKSTKLALPEVQLGVIPGGGGTQRLPRLVGITNALDIILTGKKINAKKALKIGLVHDAVPETLLLEKALELCLKGVKPLLSGSASSQPMNQEITKFVLEQNPIGRTLIEKKSIEQIEKNTKGKYPAPIKALEAVLKGFSAPIHAGLALEARLFGECVVSSESRSLVHVFEIMTAAKKNPFSEGIEAAKSLKEDLKLGSAEVVVLGAGLMGSGISAVLSENGIRSALVDREALGLGKGLDFIRKHFDDKVKRKRLKKFESASFQNMVRPVLTSKIFSGLKKQSGISGSFVIEAVTEDLSVKQSLLNLVESISKDKSSEFVFASNTSSIPISKIAEVARFPENVIGMHFFSPVPKMPLVEIVVTPKTSVQTGAKAFQIASDMGKNILVVKDSPGFYTTRILAFFICEALNLISEGASTEQIDNVLENFGMPVGPLTLLDEVGIDVGAHILQVMQEAFSDRFSAPREINDIIKENRKGRKNGFGFYLYEEGKKTKPDKTIYKHFKHGASRKIFSDEEISDRCVFVFLNEAARCLDDGVIQTSNEGDLGAIFGLGFPPFLGGPFHFAKQLGVGRVVETLISFEKKYGLRFRPASSWKKTL
jgi:3-hydroxyacyl-CoA dehydrogenase / enoyl-CoA hydratase / 3-hydroxybutyryl-CoA epimerase